MTRHSLTLAVGGLFAAAAPAAAQYPSPYAYSPYGNPQRYAPTVSPYLNLLQRGNPGVNYYNFVRPMVPPATPVPMLPPATIPYTEADFGVDPQDPLARWPRPTGHPSGFMSYQGYFNSTGTIGATGQRGLAPRPMTPGRR